MFILASQSPRRRQLLSQLIGDFAVMPADIDESAYADELAADHVQRLARSKAEAIAAEHPQAWVMGSDTIVVVDQRILGKPKDYQDFTKMMALLAGRTHQVMTAVSLVSPATSQTLLVTTEVTFTQLSHEDVHWYWLTGEPKDKAGGYGIQGLGGRFVEAINGSYSAVVGLPLAQSLALIRDAGWKDYERRITD